VRWWKWLGLAGLLGAAAAGAVVVQRQRRRTWQDYSAEELRQRLHERLRAATDDVAAEGTVG
jgi:hypothetical protein